MKQQTFVLLLKWNVCDFVKLILTLLFIQVTATTCSKFFNIAEFIEFHKIHPLLNQQSAMNLANFKEIAMNVQQVTIDVDQAIRIIPSINETKSENQEFNSVMDATKILCNVTIGLLEDFSAVQFLKSEDRKKFNFKSS